MCLGAHVNTDFADTADLAALQQRGGTVEFFMANACSLRQGCDELRNLTNLKRPDFICLTETHLLKDPIKPLSPPGYKQVARLDRTINGGGLLICSKKHLLCNMLDLQLYNSVGISEMVGIEFNGTEYILCYTPNSSAAPGLLKQMELYTACRGSSRHLIFMGDFNIHNLDWIHSVIPVDLGGTLAQEFSEIYLCATLRTRLLLLAY